MSRRSSIDSIAVERGPCHSMPMGLGITFAAALAALATQSASASQPAPLKPAGPWNVEYADNMCILAREFGGGVAKVTLGFKPGLFSDHMRVVLVTAGSLAQPVSGSARISFDGAASVEGQFVEAGVKDKGVRVMAMDVMEFDANALNNIKQLHIKAGTLNLSFAPTALPAALQALETCKKDLLVSWGMDVAVVAAIDRHPKIRGGLRSVFRPADYPRPALVKNEQGTAGVRLWVGTDGKAKDCRVIESSGSVLIDNQTCVVLQSRGRFEPARTKNGQAVAAIAFERVRWEISGR